MRGSITSLFKSVAEKNPGRVAVRYWGDGEWRQLNYAELLEQAQSVAAWLRELGVDRGDAVIVPCHRSSSLCGQLLGILWVGAHYVFLDTDYPLERQRLICRETGGTIGICPAGATPSGDLPVTWHQLPAKLPEALADPAVDDPELPAYIMFTSGSTGVPKGVVIPHRGVTRLVTDTDYISFSEDQVFLQLAALSFDASTLELWGGLLNGGCCVLYPAEADLHPAKIGEVIEANDVTTLWLTSSLYNTIVTDHAECLQPVKQLLVGGEALSVAHVRQGLAKLPGTRLFNGYGPTENTTFTTVYPIPRDLPDEVTRIPIGFPIGGTSCEVFDEHLAPVADGVPGELLAFGDGLALEYLNRSELTAERFVEVRCGDGVIRRGYRTGDWVVKLADGCFDYLRRNDKQVKIDGHRIEPEEIERFLNGLGDVCDARVVVKTGPSGQKRLAAYVVGRGDPDRGAVRAQLSGHFPDFMVPHFIISLPALPTNRNGKLDEARLPDPFLVPISNSEANEIVSRIWRDILDRPVPDDENFMDAGGTSLEALQLTERLAKKFSRPLSATFVFEYPTINAQVKFFAGADAGSAVPVMPGAPSPERFQVAVVGMACRLPGADNVEEYWDNLLNGRESITFFNQAELSNEISEAERRHPNYIRAKGVVKDCDRFDAAFFDISPAEARVMDPQQRIMLQLAWHALEHAGCLPGDNRLRTGMFAGANWPRYFQQYVLDNDDVKRSFGPFNASLANESDFLSTRISYKLNLKGPSINVFTACSTGLVAIAQAAAGIERGECEMALAGGVSISTPVNSGYRYQEGSMLSRDGHCRPFDEAAAGTTFNDGAGLVVLKRLDLAERDGDHIYAVIKGFAINNDGEAKASFTAPSVGGQVAVYDAALKKANVDPGSIGFIETHGTATPLGDPIEVRALAQGYARSGGMKPASCVIGSVKSNIGHTIHAAGAAGFIKAVMAVDRGLIPPTLHFNQPNPKLELEKTPFYVNNSVVEWGSEGPRRAAVSSLGVGGTNAHIIVEQYPQERVSDNRQQLADATHPAFSVVVSAKDDKSLDRQIARYRDFFASRPIDFSMADAAYASVFTRRHFQYRAAVSGATAQEIAANLADKQRCVRGRVSANAGACLGFVFSGQGSQRPLMGDWLYRHSQEFRQLLDLGSEIVLEQEGFDPRAILFNREWRQDIGLDINQTKVTQPALLMYEYGLARYLLACGCQPGFLIGHSIGEFAAAALAGVFDYEDAVRLVARRGALMQSMPTGKMLAVKARVEEIGDVLSEDVCIAAVNAPDRLVLAGSGDGIANVIDTLSGRNVANTVLHTSHAFHSVMMAPMVADFEDMVQSISMRAPQIPIFSTATGVLLTDEQAVDPSYWAMQLQRPVRFSDAVSAAGQHFSQRKIVFTEVGPGTVLSSLLACRNDGADNVAVSATPGCAVDSQCMQELSRALNVAWAGGVDIDWQVFFRGVQVRRTALPGYAFLPDVHWLAPAGRLPDAAVAHRVAPQSNPTMQEVTMSAEEHRQVIENKLRALLEDVSGFDLGDVGADAHFSEAGFDSLLLTQAATAIDREFSVGLTFRHLMEDYTSITELSGFIADKVPAATRPAPQPVTSAVEQAPAGPLGDGVQQLIQQQLRIMQLQLQALGAGTSVMSTTEPLLQAAGQIAGLSEAAKAQGEEAAQPGEAEKSKPAVRHTPGTRITRDAVGVKLTGAQQEWLDSMMTAFQEKFAKSKAYTQKHRKYLADPRTVSGFNPEWKEIVFPIVTERSKGARLWDIDGNELIDTANGFGPIFFGHSPDFITEAVKAQLDLGIETGPQSPLAGDVAQLFCELTGNERCAFASTGSEAVMGAIRLARTVTGRNKVVMFEGSYHGIFDEVIARPGRNYQALPAAPGITRETTGHMLVLPWGEQESLNVIAQLGDELAAVLVEPVQSRKPSFHDETYLRAIRDITHEHGVAMILDEVVTGFRVHPGGIRQRFGIDADLGTYGKVVGGGHPIGIIGGKARFMDALDGGYWTYGDDSIPECGVTFFAGTFVRHPVALAAAKAVLERIQREGIALYDTLEQRTSAMAEQARACIDELKCEAKFESFASFFYVAAPANAHWGHMLFVLMTMEGIHIQQYRPNFLTVAHSEDDVAAILRAFKKSLARLVANGLVEGDRVAANRYLSEKPKIPAGARLGKNAQGEPAYFIEDPNNAGQYLEVGKP